LSLSISAYNNLHFLQYKWPTPAENSITLAERAHELDSTLLAAQKVKSMTSARPSREPPNDKLAVYGIDDPLVDSVVCHYTTPEKGGLSGGNRAFVDLYIHINIYIYVCIKKSLSIAPPSRIGQALAPPPRTCFKVNAF
jgi:hypothetical protein